MLTIKPINLFSIPKLIDRNIPIITLEEHSIIGWLGSIISKIIAENEKSIKFKRMGVNDEFLHYVGGVEF